MVQTATSSTIVPTVVRRRTNALRNLQLKMTDIETKLSEEVHKLECKYAKLFEPIYNQRERIVNGEYEPNEEEATWNFESNDDEELTAPAGGSVSKKQKTDKSEEDIMGLPEFWLRAMESNSLLRGLIDEADKPVLRHLRDIRVKLNDTRPGYTLEFHFNENEWFTNKVLSKTYELNTERSKTNPLSGEVSPLAVCLGTEIEWREGKNLIEQLDKKKQSKASGSSSKPNEDEDDEDDNHSFFSFFATRGEKGVNPLVSGHIDPAQINELEDLAHLFELDYEIGQTLKDVIVPKAVLYFTGELEEENEEEDAFPFGGEDEDDEDDDEDDDDDDDDDEDEEDEKPKKKRGGK